MQSFADEPLTLTLEEQTAFNIARWAELVADPEWERWEGRIETDEFGNVIMKPLAPVFHGRAMAEIAYLLDRHLGGAGCIVCPISTSNGVKGADVAWMTKEDFEKVRDEPCLSSAPPICVEVLTPSDNRREMVNKKALYFEAGAVEVWFCDRTGKMTFFLSPEDAGSGISRFCPAFPSAIGL